jgi:hypothetical protein
MNKKMFQNISDKVARVATEKLNENLQGIAQEMAKDQSIWLNKIMQDILPPRLFDAAIRGDLLDEVGEYLKKNHYQLVFIPDSLSVRVMRGTEVHAEFKSQFTIDGVPVDMRPGGIGSAGLN